AERGGDARKVGTLGTLTPNRTEHDMDRGILVVGSVNSDFSARGAKLPKPGETAKAGEFAEGLGGKGANQAVAVARLGVRVGLVARVGADDRGRAAVRQLRGEGVDVGRVAEV